MKTCAVLICTPDDVRRASEQPLMVADTRPPDAYRQAHLPNALPLFSGAFVDRSTGGYLAPSGIAERLGELGIESESFIALYDDGYGVFAGKALQALDAVGHRDIALLNGGIAAWHATGGELSTQLAKCDATVYDAGATRDPFATKEWILRELGRNDLAVVDTRSVAEYRGIEKRAERNGHIPGAIHFDWMDALATDERRALFYLPERLMRNRLEAKGIAPDKEVVLYCQTGTRSSSLYAALRTLDYPRVRNYLGSWAEWGNDPKTPVVEP